MNSTNDLAQLRFRRKQLEDKVDELTLLWSQCDKASSEYAFFRNHIERVKDELCVIENRISEVKRSEIE